MSKKTGSFTIGGHPNQGEDEESSNKLPAVEPLTSKLTRTLQRVVHNKTKRCGFFVSTTALHDDNNLLI